MAHELGSPLVRIMTSKKEQILWGLHGAEHWNVAKGAWDTLPPLIAPAVDLARAEGVRLVVETGNGTMVNSNYTARKLIDELDAKDTLQVLWDPANNCWCHENAFPEGYDEIRDGYLGHLHIKDVKVDTPRATLEVREMGKGQLADQFAPMAAALPTPRPSGPAWGGGGRTRSWAAGHSPTTATWSWIHLLSCSEQGMTRSLIHSRRRGSGVAFCSSC